tara:strand:+ start:95 stop:196 length:102 start_codon:yes stop_codon:yes gene_type:complete
MNNKERCKKCGMKIGYLLSCPEIRVKKGKPWRK